MEQTRGFEWSSWQAVERFLPEGWRELASETGIIKPVPEQLGAKVGDIGVLLWLVLHHVTSGESLKTTTAAAAGAHLIDISPVALHLRMRRLGPYLTQLLARMLGTRTSFAPERWAGYEVVACDSSAISGLGAKGTDAYVHYALRLPDLWLMHVEATESKVGETLRRYAPKRGQLWIGDRGMCRAAGIAHVVKAKADVLVRYHFHSLPLFDRSDTPLDVRALVLGERRRRVVRARSAWMHSTKGKRIGGRLVWVRLPEKKAAEARRRLHLERRGKESDEDLALAEYVVLFTTVPRSRLRAAALLRLYRLRWQVELQIKRDKSITGLGKLPNLRPDTQQTWLAAKLLAQQLAQRLAAQGADFSP